jgi:DNA-binding LacI/PurR family transcriptional regulator
MPQRDNGAVTIEDVAVTGFHDIWYAAPGVPALTTASHPVHDITAAGVRGVLDPAAAPDVSLIESVLVPRVSA